MALDTALKLIETRGKTLLVPLHDGFITAEKLDLTELNDMIRGVFWSKSYIKFEHEKISSRIIVDPLGSEIEKDAHTARLAAEERQARQPFGLQ